MQPPRELPVLLLFLWCSYSSICVMSFCWIQSACQSLFPYIPLKCVQGSTVRMTWWSGIGVWELHPCWGLLSTSVYSLNILYCRMYWKCFLLLLTYSFHLNNIMQLANLDAFYVIVRMTSANICNQQCLCHCFYSWSNMMGSLQLLLWIICSKLFVCLIVLVKKRF